MRVDILLMGVASHMVGAGTGSDLPLSSSQLCSKYETALEQVSLKVYICA